MRIAILQPGYLPWLGFFEQMASVDLFVYYDDVQYTKGDWRNRNRIKTPAGPRWLTVPVRKAAHDTPINRIAISYAEPWPDEHLRKIAAAYRAAPYFEPFHTRLADILRQRCEWLCDLDIAVAALCARFLDVHTPTRPASQLALQTTDKNARLLEVCRACGATELYDGAAAAAFVDVAWFAQRGVRVTFQNYAHPVYAQLHGDFVSHLSAIDLVMQAGPEAGAIMRSGVEKRSAAVAAVVPMPRPAGGGSAQDSRAVRDSRVVRTGQ